VEAGLKIVRGQAADGHLTSVRGRLARVRRSTAELLQQHGAKPWVGTSHIHRVHQLLLRDRSGWRSTSATAWRTAQAPPVPSARTATLLGLSLLLVASPSCVRRSR